MTNDRHEIVGPQPFLSLVNQTRILCWIWHWTWASNEKLKLKPSGERGLLESTTVLPSFGIKQVYTYYEYNTPIVAATPFHSIGILEEKGKIIRMIIIMIVRVHIIGGLLDYCTSSHGFSWSFHSTLSSSYWTSSSACSTSDIVGNRKEAVRTIR